MYSYKAISGSFVTTFAQNGGVLGVINASNFANYFGTSANPTGPWSIPSWIFSPAVTTDYPSIQATFNKFVAMYGHALVLIRPRSFTFIRSPGDGSQTPWSARFVWGAGSGAIVNNGRAGGLNNAATFFDALTLGGTIMGSGVQCPTPVGGPIRLYNNFGANNLGIDISFNNGGAWTTFFSRKCSTIPSSFCGMYDCFADWVAFADQVASSINGDTTMYPFEPSNGPLYVHFGGASTDSSLRTVLIRSTVREGLLGSSIVYQPEVNVPWTALNNYALGNIIQVYLTDYYGRTPLHVVDHQTISFELELAIAGY
jgi:hypothetical protein